jgi:hypothetical protein
VRCVRFMLRIAIRGEKWAKIDQLLQANLVEHELQSALDAPNPDRFSIITARTVLLGGTQSPDSVSGPLLNEIATAIPRAEVELIPRARSPRPSEAAETRRSVDCRSSSHVRPGRLLSRQWLLGRGRRSTEPASFQGALGVRS